MYVDYVRPKKYKIKFTFFSTKKEKKKYKIKFTFFLRDKSLKMKIKNAHIDRHSSEFFVVI